MSHVTLTRKEGLGKREIRAQQAGQLDTTTNFYQLPNSLTSTALDLAIGADTQL